MSKVAIKGASTGTGTFTIESPATNTDRTLSLPDQTGTLLSSSAQGIPKSALPTGSVLQVVSTQYQTSVSTSSTSPVDTGLSLSITPTSATSKILVLVSQSMTPLTVGSDNYAIVEVHRNSTIIVQDQRTNNKGQYNHYTWSCCQLDSPGTTSAVTYKTKFATGNSSYLMEAQHAGLRPSQITLMEIAA